MERKYFTINEESAKLSHSMMSMSDYAEGSKTAEYRKAADKGYDLAAQVAEKRPEEAERAYWLAERYAKKLADYYNRESTIGVMCPSVLVSGRGNFPVKKKNRQVAAFDRNHKFYMEEVMGVYEKLERMLYGRSIIKSNDERAIEKLEAKLHDMKELQERIKAANKAIRLKDAEAGDDALREMGYSEADIKELRKPDFCGRVGYPSYILQNNNAGIRRVEERLKSLREVKGRESAEREYNGFKVIENTENMRYQIIFEERPEAAVRDILKSNGFRWAPSQGAWQRQITVNGKYALERVIGSI